jgi:predicted ATPase
MTDAHRFVITGGPGFGKTTILRKISRMGFRVEEEAARKLILQSLNKSEPMLPWRDREQFDRELEGLMISSYYRAEPGITFYDRGIPDFIGWNLFAGKPIDRAIELSKSFRYDRVVFLTAPNLAIHVKDKLRPFTFEQATQINLCLAEGYKLVGYEIRQLPINDPDSLAILTVRHAKASMVE